MDEILNQCWAKIVRHIMSSYVLYKNMHRWNTLESLLMGGWTEMGMGDANKRKWTN